ncbi:class 1 fructose-1,6-bisphosphatase [Sphingobacterium sp. SGL-16]|uniref:class 1 fructose-bisphosphatase n=1 Tax=Sphingobacterium sp. SGL-16 TaxID=2710883 RepID=UPI0019D01FF4|nr:class 1 fructose-bisphosphatase [Sphingobacterium sp. SGL-16]
MICDTISQHLNKDVQDAVITPNLSSMLMDIVSASKVISGLINRNIFDTLSNSVETLNTHGEKQHRLDIEAHNVFLSFLQKGNQCHYLISEECEDTLELNNINHQGTIYTVCMDPLDGSSNIDVNVSVGSVFSIYSQERKLYDGYPCIKSGREQKLAGYVIYGTSTMLVIAYGTCVYGFTLDSISGEYMLTHPNIRLSKSGNTYAINEGNCEDFPYQIRDFLAFCKQSDSENNFPYKSRYVGSMVADMHRTLMQGGIFLYPSTRKHPKGKLRLLYECNPMAYIIEQAGGLAIDGMRPILSVPVVKTHQKVPFIAGSYNIVKYVLSLYKNESINNHVFYSC